MRPQNQPQNTTSDGTKSEKSDTKTTSPTTGGNSGGREERTDAKENECTVLSEIDYDGEGCIANEESQPVPTVKSPEPMELGSTNVSHGDDSLEREQDSEESEAEEPPVLEREEPIIAFGEDAESASTPKAPDMLNHHDGTSNGSVKLVAPVVLSEDSGSESDTESSSSEDESSESDNDADNEAENEDESSVARTVNTNIVTPPLAAKVQPVESEDSDDSEEESSSEEEDDDDEDDDDEKSDNEQPPQNVETLPENPSRGLEPVDEAVKSIQESVQEMAPNVQPEVESNPIPNDSSHNISFPPVFQSVVAEKSPGPQDPETLESTRNLEQISHDWSGSISAHNSSGELSEACSASEDVSVQQQPVQEEPEVYQQLPPSVVAQVNPEAVHSVCNGPASIAAQANSCGNMAGSQLQNGVPNGSATYPTVDIDVAHLGSHLESPTSISSGEMATNPTDNNSQPPNQPPQQNYMDCAQAQVPQHTFCNGGSTNINTSPGGYMETVNNQMTSPSNANGFGMPTPSPSTNSNNSNYNMPTPSPTANNTSYNNIANPSPSGSTGSYLPNPSPNPNNSYNNMPNPSPTPNSNNYANTIPNPSATNNTNYMPQPSPTNQTTFNMPVTALPHNSYGSIPAANGVGNHYQFQPQGAALSHTQASAQRIQHGVQQCGSTMMYQQFQQQMENCSIQKLQQLTSLIPSETMTPPPALATPGMPMGNMSVPPNLNRSLSSPMQSLPNHMQKYPAHQRTTSRQQQKSTNVPMSQSMNHNMTFTPNMAVPARGANMMGLPVLNSFNGYNMQAQPMNLMNATYPYPLNQHLPMQVMNMQPPNSNFQQQPQANNPVYAYSYINPGTYMRR